MTKAPAFVKFFIAEINNIDMKIPVAFTRRMKQALPEKVFLRDRHNKIWIVKVAKVGECWYFVDGWDKFVHDNLLTTGDVMVCQYFCERLFNVKLYGPSATEKNVIGPSKNVVGPSTLKSVEKQKQVSEYDDNDCDDDHDHECTESENCNYKSVRQDRDNEDDQDEKDEETEGGDEDSVLMRRKGNEHREVVDQEQVNNDGAGVGRNSTTRGRLRYLYARCYGMDIFEAGLAEQPRNPYFVAKIMPKRKSDLFIPQDVIKDYSINLGHEIILVDPTGREFRAKCKKWKDGRSILSGGWSYLCRLNLVTIEDSCICEFVPREGDPRQFLHVSFVRGNTMEN